jgi:hypothetical protein
VLQTYRNDDQEQRESVEGSVLGLSRKYTVFKYAWRTNRAHAIDLVLAKINRQFMPNFRADINEIGPAQSGSVLFVYKEPLYDEGLYVPRLQATERQSRWQGRQVIEYFDTQEYRVDVASHHDSVTLEDPSAYDVVIGQGPNFCEFARQAGDSTTIIQYATAMHWSQRNAAIREDYERFNRTYDVEFTPRRVVPEDPSSDIADEIIVIGDEYARATFTRQVPETPVRNIEVSTYDFLTSGIEQTSFEQARRNFLWFSGSGLVFKGLDLVLSVFEELDELDLYVCAPLEADTEFCNLFHNKLFQRDNIYTKGWVDVGSETFRKLTEDCAYVVAPSVTDGSPGGIAHSMRRGVVPLLTKEVIRDVGDWGIQFPGRSEDSIRDTVQRAARREPAAVEAMARRACERAKTHHGRDQFRRSLHDALDSFVESPDVNAGRSEQHHV